MTGPVFHPRTALETDIPRIAEILNATWEAVWAEAMEYGATRSWFETEMAEKIAAGIWPNCAVTETDGSIAGFVCLDGDEVATLHVDPTASRRGIGRALMGEAETRIAAAGYGAVRLETEAFNTGAHAFYMALGYRETRRFTGQVIGYSVPCIEMRKDL